MTHEITETDQMFYAEENGPPWHGLGIPVQEALTSKEAAELTMPWTVSMEPVKRRNRSGVVQIVPGQMHVVRDDIDEVLGTVKGHYVPIQNAEIFGFLDELVATGDLRYETAGSLMGGKWVWMLARVPDEIVLGGDVSYPYLLAVSSHDGSLKLRVMPTIVRAVCKNTVNAALFTSDEDVQRMTVAIKHQGNVRNQLSLARETLGLSLTAFTAFQVTGEKLLQTDGLPMVDKFLEEMFPTKSVKEVSTVTANKRESFMAILASERERSGSSKPTGYDLLNAATGYADHVLSVEHLRGGDTETTSQADRRFISAFQPHRAGYDFKAKAAKMILTMAGIYRAQSTKKVTIQKASR